jgi:hypothetical protein
VSEGRLRLQHIADQIAIEAQKLKAELTGNGSIEGDA